ALSRFLRQLLPNLADNAARGLGGEPDAGLSDRTDTGSGGIGQGPSNTTPNGSTRQNHFCGQNLLPGRERFAPAPQNLGLMVQPNLHRGLPPSSGTILAP